MSRSAIIAVVIAAVLSAPAFAGGGGGGGRGGRGGGGGGFGGGGGGPGGGGFGGGGAGGFGGGGPGGGGFGGGGPGGGGFGGGGPGGGGFGGGVGPDGVTYGATGTYNTPVTGGGRNPGGYTGTTRTTVQRTTVQRTSGLTGGPMRLPLDDGYEILGTTSIFAQNRVAQSIGELVLIDPVPAVTTPAFRGDAPMFRGVVKDRDGDAAVLEIQEQDPNSARSVINNPHSLKAGGALEWNGGTYQIKSVDVENRTMLLQRPGEAEPITLAIGFNILGQPMQALSDIPYYRSADAQGVTNTQNTQNGGGRGGRGGRGGNAGFGATNTPATGVYGAAGGGYGGATGVSMAGLQSALVTSLDPPLPPGSADNLEARMRNRRDTQLSAPDNVVTTPTGTGTLSPTGTILQATPTTPAPAAPTTPGRGG